MEDTQCTFLDKSNPNVMEPKPSRAHLYQSVLILNMLYLVCGTTFAWSSPVLSKLTLTDPEGSSVASMLALGSLLGPFISGSVADILGRKGTVCLSMVLATVSYLVMAFFYDVTALTIGRFIAGAMVGITNAAVPMYIAEISEDSLRGFLNTLSMISVSIGSLIVYSIGPFVSYAVLHYILIGICVSFFLLYPLLPHSPQWLVMKNKISTARDNLTWLRGSKSSVEKELEAIQRTVKKSQAEKGSTMDLYYSKSNRKALMICCGLVIIQQLSGISIVFYFTQKLFEMSGTSMSSSMCSMVIGVILLVSSFIVPSAVERFGYKIPLLVSASGMALGMGGLGVFFLLKDNNFDIDLIHYMPLISLVTYITFFNSGFSNIPWALSGELFSSNVKPQATAIITVTCGLFAFFSTNLFPDLVLLFGIDSLFMFFSFCCCLAVVFITLVVQDTSGLSFVEIQELLKGENRKNILLRRQMSVQETLTL